MSASKAKMQEWALGKIEALSPPATNVTAIDDLYHLTDFFDGDGKTLFGMMTTPAAFEDPAELVEAARAALSAWFDHFGETGQHEQQAQLYNIVAQWSPVPEPALVRQQREALDAAEAAKTAALAGLPTPLEAIGKVSAPLAAALRDARGPDDFFSKHGSALTPLKDRSLDLGNFEWLDVDAGWERLADSGFPPPFFPFAGSDGDYVGVVVLKGDPFVAYHSHEEGFFFMAESLKHWRAMCDAAQKGGRGAAARIEKARGDAPSRAGWSARAKNAYAAAFEQATAALKRVREG